MVNCDEQYTYLYLSFQSTILELSIWLITLTKIIEIKQQIIPLLEILWRLNEQ